VIVFEFGNHQFPEKGWNDFVVVILGAWLDSLAKLMNGQSNYEELWFMDGPFYLAITKIEKDFFDFAFHDEREGGESFKFSCSLTCVYTSALNVSKEIHVICLKNNWADDDISSLGRSIKICDRNKLC
jgi:hypothetical protein